jgi:hypothetical protein
MDILRGWNTGDSFAGTYDMSRDDHQLLEADYSPFGRRKSDHSLYERQVRGRIVTALNRSRRLAGQLVGSQ